ncbi:hypothetical protein, partial [Duncaniella muris]|uniref:hypothetical protein n=1 Tax=Duncaniella muris TaxID=2094150 RepID=UPI00351D2547
MSSPLAEAFLLVTLNNCYETPSKTQTKVNKLRGNEKTRYEIFNAVNAAWNDKSIYTFEQFENHLKAVGV